MLILTVPEDLHELLQDGCLASIASLREMRRVVIVTVHLSLMLIVAVLGTEDCGTDGTGKVLDVVFSVESSDV